MDKYEKVLERVNALVAEHVGCELSELEGATFGDLSCDDLDMVEMVIIFEEEWTIEITDEEVAHNMTLEHRPTDVAKLIAGK